MDIIENPTVEQLKTLKGIIYRIKNKKDGKSYIGQTEKSFYGRYSSKWWKIRERERGRYVNNALECHGYKNFEVSILEYGLKTLDELGEREKYWIAFFDTMVPNGYNLQDGGKRCEFSQETREKLRQATLKRYNKTYTLRDKDGNIYTFNNLEEFGRIHGVFPQNLRSLFWKKTRTCGKQKFHLLETDIRIFKENGKIYEVKDADGKIYKIYNVLKFCKEHDVVISTMWKVIEGRAPHCNNKFFPIKDVIYKGPKNNSKYKVTLIKEETEYLVEHVGNFCKKYEISLYFFRQLRDGKIECYKGFSLKECINY